MSNSTVANNYCRTHCFASDPSDLMDRQLTRPSNFPAKISPDPPAFSVMPQFNLLVLAHITWPHNLQVQSFLNRILSGYDISGPSLLHGYLLMYLLVALFLLGAVTLYRTDSAALPPNWGDPQPGNSLSSRTKTFRHPVK